MATQPTANLTMSGDIEADGLISANAQQASRP
jgi:hypothetical protein